MKIVSLSPSFTEILNSLDRISFLTGVSDHCPDLWAVTARVGSPKALNLSLIESLQPDLILASVRENRPEEIRELEKKFKVTAFDVRSVDHAIDAVNTIGRLTGAQAASEALISKISEEAAQCKMEKDLPRVKSLILLWNIPYLTVNFDTYISRLLELAGGFNVFHEDPLPEFPIELEDMIEKEPEVLFLPTEPFPFKKRDIKKFRQYRNFSKIPIEIVPGRFFSNFGPATVEALRYFREIFSKVRACQPKA